MADALLSTAHSQAERSSPAVRAAARMRIARVESAADPGRARITFEMALAEVRGLSGRSRQALLQQAEEIAAALAPDLLREIQAPTPFPSEHRAATLLSIMLSHGHIDAAFDFVLRCDAPFGFPFSFAGNLMHELDEERRISVLRSAIGAWRAPQDAERMRRHGVPLEEGHLAEMRTRQLQAGFTGLFSHYWTVLPAEEALAAVREIVRAARELPDLQTSAGYPDGIHFTSSREHILFEVFHVLRRLDPAMAESLAASHAELATAIGRYPHGIETVQEEAERAAEERRKQMAASGETCEGGWIFAGGGGDFERQMALERSARAGDFGPSLEHALELYAEDSDPEHPNRAEKSFWPSTTSLRTTLYSAGKRLGPDAAALLGRIPDADLRLFAQIELAAALAGLPALPETSMKQRRRPPMQGTPMRARDGSEIRCPECRWIPVEEARWPCRCGHLWNTFDTRGRCPSCDFQWEITQCLQCGEVSPHDAWYPEE